jgi:hypothetical protein
MKSFSKQLVINSYMPPYYNIIGFSAAIHLNKFLKWYETGTRAVLNNTGQKKIPNTKARVSLQSEEPLKDDPEEQTVHSTLH